VKGVKIVIIMQPYFVGMHVSFPLQNIEEDHKPNRSLLKALAKVLAFLQDIEA
jgi:hypothetical protein